jgi:hypothetical protein
LKDRMIKSSTMSQVLCSTIVPEFLQVFKIKLRDSIVWHSQVSQYMWYLWILTKTIKMLCLLLPTSMWGFIGREKARAYLQCIYCKVKQWIQRELSHTIKSRYACVCNIWWICMVANPNSTLLLENISPFWNLETIAREQGLSIHLFLGGHLSTHCFRYLRYLSIF